MAVEIIGSGVGLPIDDLPSKVWSALEDQWELGNEYWDDIHPVDRQTLIKIFLETPKGREYLIDALCETGLTHVRLYKEWTLQGFTEAASGAICEQIEESVGGHIADVYHAWADHRFAPDPVSD